MPTERSDEPSGCSLPQLDRFVERSAHKVVAIWRESDLNDQPLVAGHPLHRFGLADWMPHDHCVVIRARHQYLALWTASFLIPLQCILLHRRKIFRIGKLHRVIIAACLENIIRRQGKRVDPVRMSLQLMNQRALGYFPDFDCPILARCIQ